MKAHENSPSKLGMFMPLAIAFVIVVFAASAQGASAGNSNNAFAVGGITTADGHVAFAAHLNPQNGNVNGHVVQDSFGTSRSGPVTCVTVMNGNMAVVVWMVNNSDNPSEIGQTRSFEVMDNGEPKMGISPDMFCDRGCFNNNCYSFQGCGTMPLHGNIVVKGP